MGNLVSQLWPDQGVLEAAPVEEDEAPLDPRPKIIHYQPPDDQEPTNDQSKPSNTTGDPGGISLFGSATNMNVNLENATVTSVAGNLNSTTNIFMNMIPAPNPYTDEVSPATAFMRSRLSLGDHPIIQTDTYRRRAIGTGEWFLSLKDFTEWKATRGRIIWATGMPGAGKTHLASCAINHIDGLAKTHQNVTLAYAYFEYSKKSSILQVLESLVRQQAEWSPDFIELVAQTLLAIQRERRTPTEDDYIGLLKKMSEASNASFYYLDGLDEAPPDTQFDTIEIFSSINANLCIFSRPLDAMQQRMKDSLRDVVFVEVSAQDEDIELLIEQKISRTPEFVALLKNDEKAKAELIRKIKEKAGGMFLHASLQIEALRHCVSVSKMLQRLKELPMGIDGLYAVTLDRINMQPADRAELAKQIITWLLYIREPLTVVDLQYALASSPITPAITERDLIPETQCVSVCCGLIKVDSEGRLRLIHLTAKGILQRMLASFCAYPHSMISEACLGRLMSSTIQTFDPYLDQCSIHTFLDKNPFLKYSYYHLPNHLRVALSTPDPTIIKPAMRFLRQCHQFPSVTKKYLWTSANGVLFDRLTPLHVAAWFGLPTLVERLIEEDHPDVNIRTVGDQKLTPLMLACLSGQREAAASLLTSQHINANLVDWEGMTALMWAAVAGSQSITQMLVSFPGIDVSAKDRRGRNALAHAVLAESFECTRILLAIPGFDINAKDKQGKCLGNYIPIDEIVRAMTKRVMADHLSKTTHNPGHSIADLVVAHPGFDLSLLDLNRLLDCSALPTLALLELAAYRCLEHEVRLLLSAPSPASSGHESAALIAALDHAHHEDNRNIIRMLLETGKVDINFRDASGRTPLIVASAHYETTVETFELLLDYPGIDVNAVDNLGKTALLELFDNLDWSRNLVFITMLFAVDGIDVNRLDQAGRTPLMIAISANNQDLIRQLLKVKGIAVNAVDTDGRTALIHSCTITTEHPHFDYGETVRLLLETQGIDVNAVDKEGRTALMYAVQACNESNVQALLESEDIDVEILAPNGKTAPSMAESRGISDLLFHHSTAGSSSRRKKRKKEPVKYKDVDLLRFIGSFP